MNNYGFNEENVQTLHNYLINLPTAGEYYKKEAIKQLLKTNQQQKRQQEQINNKTGMFAKLGSNGGKRRKTKRKKSKKRKTKRGKSKRRN
jgi:hypothetical protein